jgi:membrane fusion protein, heavy metal efflux system
VLRSPIGGEVAARNISPGMEIQGQYSGGTAPELFTIGNLERVWVLADVFEGDIPRVQIGAPVSISVVSYPEHQFSGHIDWISGALDPSMRTVRVRCTIDNRQHLLRPEMFATVAITTDSHDRLAVPRSAVVRLGNEMVTFVDKGRLADGGERFERRRLAVDETDAGDFIPVIEGLTAGERVVTSGAVILSGSSNG